METVRWRILALALCLAVLAVAGLAWGWHGKGFPQMDTVRCTGKYQREKNPGRPDTTIFTVVHCEDEEHGMYCEKKSAFATTATNKLRCRKKQYPVK